MKRRLSCLCIALALVAHTLPVAAHPTNASSELSALSMLPVAVSVAAPAGLLVSGAAFTVVAVEAASEGTVWVLRRASDGAQASIVLGSAVVGGVSVAAGTAVACSAIGAGWVLSSAGKAIAFIPNEIGRALLHDERITR